MIYLISPETIKATTNVSDNLDDKYMVSAIQEAQEIDLQGIVGECLLNYLKQLVNEDTINNEENEVYKDMLDKAQYYLCYSVISKLCLLTNFKFNNFGVNTSSDEHLEGLSLADTKRLEEYYIKKADFFAKLLQEFLIDNKNNIPQLTECQCDKIKANITSSASTNIWLGGYRGQCL